MQGVHSSAVHYIMQPLPPFHLTATTWTARDNQTLSDTVFLPRASLQQVYSNLSLLLSKTTSAQCTGGWWWCGTDCMKTTCLHEGSTIAPLEPGCRCPKPIPARQVQSQVPTHVLQTAATASPAAHLRTDMMMHSRQHSCVTLQDHTVR